MPQDLVQELFKLIDEMHQAGETPVQIKQLTADVQALIAQIQAQEPTDAVCNNMLLAIAIAAKEGNKLGAAHAYASYLHCMGKPRPQWSGNYLNPKG